MASGSAGVESLSLCGLLGRLELLERYRQIRSPTDEQAAALAAEGAVKRALAERLPSLCSEGLTPHERSQAKAFLEAQIKAVDPQVAASEKRAAKLKELLAGVSEAASAKEPAHVQRARADLKNAGKDFAEVNKAYEKWDKGKQMLTIEEIKSLKRRHEEAQKRLDAAGSFVEEQLARRAEAAIERPKALEAKASAPVPPEFRPGPPKAAARGPGPAVRVKPSAGGGGGYPAPAALRQGRVAAEVRAGLAAELATEDAGRPRPKPPPAAAARPRPAWPSGGEDDGLVLSFGCACRAVAEPTQGMVYEAAAPEAAAPAIEAPTSEAPPAERKWIGLEDPQAGALLKSLGGRDWEQVPAPPAALPAVMLVAPPVPGSVPCTAPPAPVSGRTWEKPVTKLKHSAWDERVPLSRQLAGGAF